MLIRLLHEPQVTTSAVVEPPDASAQQTCGRDPENRSDQETNVASDSDLSNHQDNSPLHLALVQLRSEHSARHTTPHLSRPRRQTRRAARHVLRASLATAASLPPLSTSSSLHLKLHHSGFTSEHGLVSTAAPHQTPSRLALPPLENNHLHGPIKLSCWFTSGPVAYFITTASRAAGLWVYTSTV